MSSLAGRLLRLLQAVAGQFRRLLGRRGGPRRRRQRQPLPDYGREPEQGRYSSDCDWMAGLVLVAKNTHVWLHQLSAKHQRPVRTLDEIPDEELLALTESGIGGLWLIGIWERSRASERIKRRTGNPEAAASAYALYDYEVATDLGGWEALRSLRDRASRFGLRLSADMVPNHMGIDSRWVMEHPERFLSLDQSPFPNYTFRSADLSDDPKVGIHLEDHYYDQTEAAVVFLRRDRQTGHERYIYHGNDGTALPWNDTAQLDYTRPDVREAVIETILKVARSFPIIRFDAAMTLARQHIQRLWFPEPGVRGGINTRTGRGMTRREFDEVMPHEFWREVVDRVAAEAPDTLLLAEAFWLMEAYFVRSLGLHRVYNSAFMHMLRDEDNARYRQLLKNTLAFDPRILERQVNFMSNPDEETAFEQFGNGDRYFGVCTVMATLPGLPMFAHGQVEGLRERYGMEYRSPRLTEGRDEDLVRRHERQIFPLLRQRRLFAGVASFRLYDFVAGSGRVDENVLAYSHNRRGERAVVFYHNKSGTARGRILNFAPSTQLTAGEPAGQSLGQALDLPHEGFVVFRDHTTGLEYVRSCVELWRRGLYAELGPYQNHVFLDWRTEQGSNWDRLCSELGGGGVPSVSARLRGAA